MKSRLALLSILMLACAAAFAAGAPWYKWMSTVDKTIVCAQTSPGQGWVPYQGPFKDSGCRQKGMPQ